MEYKGLYAFGPVVCAIFILLIVTLIISIDVVLPIGVVYHFFPRNPQIEPIPNEICDDDFDGW